MIDLVMATSPVEWEEVKNVSRRILRCNRELGRRKGGREGGREEEREGFFWGLV
jgi:hypothetical protein